MSSCCWEGSQGVDLETAMEKEVRRSNLVYLQNSRSSTGKIDIVMLDKGKKRKGFTPANCEGEGSTLPLRFTATEAMFATISRMEGEKGEAFFSCKKSSCLHYSRWGNGKNPFSAFRIGGEETAPFS